MSKDLVRKAITGAFNRARFLQQAPILPDVWFSYVALTEATDPAVAPIDGRVDLLLTSSTGNEPGRIAQKVAEGVRAFGISPQPARIAHNRTTVAANLTFGELVCVVVPMTRWWNELPDDLRSFERQRLSLSSIAAFNFKSAAEIDFFTFAATAGVVGLLLSKDPRAESLASGLLSARNVTPELRPLLEEYRRLAHGFEFQHAPDGAVVDRVQINRPGSLSVSHSRQTIKADACYNLFKSSAANIKWAVIDCGIQATHPAFDDKAVPPGGARTSRVVATYDFTKIRELLSGDSTTDSAGRPIPQSLQDQLKQQRDSGRQLDWSLVRSLVEIPHVAGTYTDPAADHGTHVAGILGADWEKDPNGNPVVGVCPDIKLIDVRVFDGDKTDEFNVMAALQFIGYLNRLSDVLEIHGINLSFSFVHDVRNYACGRTPICSECERLVDNGIVVVTAAGNSGYSQQGTNPSLADRYAPMSITDPGNAASVITVGSTHRTQPHTYGVSYFSSRGPTGDGRAKPDLLAPGEKILSTTLDGQSGEKDGTSMAAPHVSGAAAILMTRNPELIGQPRKIKEVLCNTATDLGRERSFQGSGLLDVLRALQSI